MIAPSVLVVEPRAELTVPVRSELEAADLLVSAVPRGMEALRKAMSQHVDMAILSTSIPDVRAEKLAWMLRAVCGEELPVVLVAANTHDDSDVARRIEAVGYFAQPLDAGALASLVSSCLNGQ